MAAEDTGYKRFFGHDLAKLLATKLSAAMPGFPARRFLGDLAPDRLGDLELLARVDLISSVLRTYLPDDYPEALEVLVGIYGPENPNETGMFTFGYWLWPVGSFIASYGIDHPELSLPAIEELTKRHTGEYAIRPYITAHTDLTVDTMNTWARSGNVHVRRLATEGLRPRLPWAKKLTLFIEDPGPVFDVLEQLRDDPSRFVQKSVANNLNDYLKDNRIAAMELLTRWSADPTSERIWIIKHALRNELKRGEPDALELVSSLT